VRRAAPDEALSWHTLRFRGLLAGGCCVFRMHHPNWMVNSTVGQNTLLDLRCTSAYPWGMSQIAAWFERKFEFTFPLEQYPNLCIRLRGTPARLEEMLRGASHDKLIAKAGDKWSAQEHAGHLADLEPLWTARVGDFLGDGDTLTAADLSNRKTHESNHNARELQSILAEFRAGRQRLVER